MFLEAYEKNSRQVTLYFFLLVVIAGTLFHLSLMPDVNVDISRLAYLHYHFIEASAENVKYGAGAGDISAVIFKNSKPVVTIGGQRILKLSYDDSSGKYLGRFPVPWRAADGVYTVRYFSGGEILRHEDAFIVKSRIPSYKFSGPLKIMDLESVKRLSRYKVTTPSGNVTGYEGMYEWIKYIGGNTLWYIAGQTASYSKGDLTEDLPWIAGNVNSIEEFSANTGRNSIKFGGWIACFRYFGKSELKPAWYKYSYKYMGPNDRLKRSGGISILDNRRIEDVRDLAGRLNASETVDYIGLDYIRPAGGGLELVDEFIESMDVEEIPSGWSSYTQEQRMEWLGEIVTRTKNRGVPVIDKWNWWRAHRMSKIIRYIKESAQIKKPLWTFILSWELGHQHGQDPLMFQDAGADIIAVMMYETDAPRLNYMIKKWKEYLEGFRVNLAVGNQIDWPLHQYCVEPSGPEEYHRRLSQSISYLGDNVKGVFVHDFSRAMWGRKGPYTSKEWLLSAGKAFTQLDRHPEVRVDMQAEGRVRSGAWDKLRVKVSNVTGSDIERITVDIPDARDIAVKKSTYELGGLKGFEAKDITVDFRITGSPDMKMGRYMLASRVITGRDIYIDTEYINTEGVPLDRGVKYR
ncbi:MAG: hypothetical protein JXJ19_09345 [Elusimicrobia bacterium]|nr:hypothetical protein [Elusimicrobiota bacterium]